MTRLAIKIDPEVYKIKDPKVGKLLSGKLSFTAFALLVKPGDPYVLIEDTVYALTEQEFYALRSVLPINVVTDRVFQYVINNAELVDGMHEKDRRFIEKVRSDLPTCPACRYNRYKDEIYKLIKSYNIKLPVELSDALTDKAEADKAEYPDVKSSITPKVLDLMKNMYKVPQEERKACIDCVEKHLSQAWVLSKEALQGYPEYASLVVGHLGEAIAEMPIELEALRRTVEFGLARTNYTGIPFVPLMLIYPLITLGRSTLDNSISDRLDSSAATEAFELDLTEDMRNELLSIRDDTALCAYIMKLTAAADNFILGVENLDEQARLTWEGTMGALADALVDAAPKTANMLRNRRLLFYGDPTLAKQAGYMLSDIAETLSN